MAGVGKVNVDRPPDICWATPLYEFLRQCQASTLHKRVLDCGAGGDDPPLALFRRYGYETHGIEISRPALDDAQAFCRKHDLALNILRGDMRRIPFASESFSFVYAFNAIFFMTGPDIVGVIGEMKRVLEPGGLVYVNLISVDDPDDQPFCSTAPARRLLGSERFAKHRDDEADSLFADLEIIRREKRFIDRVSRGQRLYQVYIEYIARKPDENAP